MRPSRPSFIQDVIGAAALALMIAILDPVPAASAPAIPGDPTTAVPPPPAVPSDPATAVPLPPAIEPPTETVIRQQAGMIHPRGRSLYLAGITREARRQGLPPEIADAVAGVESAYDPNAVGGAGEVGLMQVMPSTAAMLGFRGTRAALFEPETNIRLGVTYLAQAWRLTGGQLCETLMKYRAGHGEVRFSQRSVDYCLRARLHLASIGSPLAQAPVPVFDMSGPAPLAGPLAGGRASGPNVPRIATRRAAGRALWAAHDARMREIQARVTDSSLSIMR